MAVTEIWKVDNRLDHVLKYTTSEDKTDGNNYKDLHNVLDYIEADYKTEQQLYVTGINCLPETAYKEMLMTKKHYHKTGGILAFHAFQSFAPGEVTPQICHEIGVKLAEEMWGDRFEVVVSTHLNRNHLHNHFVINSVSFKDGKKYYDKRDTYAELRHLSDSLCEEYGLSVIKQKEIKKFKVNYSNYQVKNLKNDNYYSTAKKDIDRAIGMANSYVDFEKLLNAMGYEVKYRYNVLTIRRDPYKKSIRVKNYGQDYTTERITERIKVESISKVPFLNEFSNNKYYRDYNYKYEKPKGIYALYLHYCYLLNVFPKKNPYKRLPPSIKNDSLKLDKISEEAKLLVSYNLETDEQFFSFKKSKIEELNNLINERESLWYKYHHEKNNDGIDIKIKKIKPKIDEVKRILSLCEGIEKRIPKIERNVEEINIERKESEKSEHIK